VEGLKVFDPDDRTRLRVCDLSLSLAQGEILGLFGLVGSGCIEAAVALYGAWPGHWEGAVTLDGAPISLDNPTVSVASGLGFMAQDRRDCLVPDHTVHDNVILASLTRSSAAGFSHDAKARRTTLDLVRDLAIKTRSIESHVGTLSGGNQQKVQVARWLAAEARILILVDPTRGVDIAARGEIKRIWAGLSAQGRAILIASTDAEELVDICDRVIVLRGGRPAGEVDRRDLTEERILRLSAGV
jgi:ABC-type sugar transport system ATPase subunit